jgi:hypothetical protein
MGEEPCRGMGEGGKGEGVRANLKLNVPPT